MKAWLERRRFIKKAMDVEEARLFLGDEGAVLPDSKFSEDWAEMQSVIGVLRECSLDEPIDTERFDTRLIRRWQVASAKSTFRYWSPAVFGAAIASVAVLALLQMLLSSSSMRPIRVLDSNDSVSNTADTVIISDMDRGAKIRLK
jgi:hypothetical protein